MTQPIRTIRIDAEVWAKLQKHAKPFEDTPNTVLRRLLGLDKKPQRRRAKRRQGRGRYQDKFRIPILQALSELGGTAPTREVLERVARKLKLTAFDRQKLQDGSERWRNAALWERLRMVREGLLDASSPRGVWSLTVKGKAVLGAKP